MVFIKIRIRGEDKEVTQTEQKYEEKSCEKNIQMSQKIELGDLTDKQQVFQEAKMKPDGGEDSMVKHISLIENKNV